MFSEVTHSVRNLVFHLYSSMQIEVNFGLQPLFFILRDLLLAIATSFWYIFHHKKKKTLFCGAQLCFLFFLLFNIRNFPSAQNRLHHILFVFHCELKTLKNWEKIKHLVHIFQTQVDTFFKFFLYFERNDYFLKRPFYLFFHSVKNTHLLKNSRLLRKPTIISYQLV